MRSEDEHQRRRKRLRRDRWSQVLVQSTANQLERDVGISDPTPREQREHGASDTSQHQPVNGIVSRHANPEHKVRTLPTIPQERELADLDLPVAVEMEDPLTSGRV